MVLPNVRAQQCGCGQAVLRWNRHTIGAKTDRYRCVEAMSRARSESSGGNAFRECPRQDSNLTGYLIRLFC